MRAMYDEGLTPRRVAEYLDRRKIEMELMEAALQAGDTETILDIAHRIKGNAALFGLPDFGLLAESVLKGIKSQDWNAISIAARKMRQSVELERQHCEELILSSGV